MRAFLASFAIAIVIGCGGRSNPEPDAGTGGAGGATGGTGGTTGGVGGTGGVTTVGGTGGTTIGGTGGVTTVGGTGGTTIGGTGGTTVGGGEGGATVGGTGGTGTGGTGTGGKAGSGGSGGIPVDLQSCTGPGQCELQPTQCCSCGVLGLSQVTAINSMKRSEFKTWSCGPAPQGCPPCVGMADPYLGARCESGMCRAFDLRSDPTFTKCGSDQECVLRNGLGCCECNGASNWVAISRVGAMLLTSQVCGPMSVCPGCIPSPPADLVSVCRSGACVEMRIPISNVPY